MWNHIYQELHFSDIEVCQIYFRKHMFFQRTSAYLLFSFSWLLFPLVTFFPSSIQPLLLLVLCYMVLSCRYYCCLEGLRISMENVNTLIFLCSEHTSPLEILFLDINSFVSFYTWCIFVPVPMLTYFLCSERILLKLDSNVMSISSCFRRVKFFPLLSLSAEQSCLKSALQC